MKPKRAAVIAPDGTWEWKYLDFEGCQQAVGGFVQVVHLGGPLWAYLNEDGISQGLPDNPLATKLVVMLGNGVLYDRAIRGPMVLVGDQGRRDCPAALFGIPLDKTLKMLHERAVLVEPEVPDAPQAPE